MSSLEEHAFSLELAAAEIPLIAPQVFNGETLHRHEGFRFALFRRQGGHAPELESRDTRLWLGRFIARIHAVGSSKPFRHRPALTPERFGDQAIRTIVEGQWLPSHLENAFASLAADLMTAIPCRLEQGRCFQDNSPAWRLPSRQFVVARRALLCRPG
jgi:Ser/Thr protein kinase RdoA (MazF antagonist)